MPIRFKCEHCKKGLVVKEQMAGKKALCPSCKKPVMVPAPVSQAVDMEALAAAALSDQPAAEEKKEAAAGPAPPIKVTCSWCGEEATFDAEMGGKKAPCPNPECRRIIPVPKPEGTKRKDWREVHAGPSAALANQPQQLDGAWGTTTHKGKVSQTALIEADAIPEEVEPIGIAGWIKRGLVVTAIIGIVVLAWWGLSRRQADQQQTDAIDQALEVVEGKNADPKYPKAWGAIIFRGAGEHFTTKSKAKRARELFQNARARIDELKSYDRDMFALNVALPQVGLGGTDEEARDDKRSTWGEVAANLDRTLTFINAAEARARAVREVGTLLIRRQQPSVAVTLPGKLGASAPKGLLAELLKAQQAALMGKDAAKVLPAPNPKLKLADLATRLGHVEAHVRQGNLAEAKELVKADGPPEHRFQAALGAAAVLQSEGKEFTDFLQAADGLAATFKKLSPWHHLELVRLHAYAGASGEATTWLKKLPDKQLKAWGDLEIFLAELARSKTKAEASRVEEVGDKDGLPRALAWEAFARHNTRLNYRSDVSALIKSNAEDAERRRINPLLHLGMALGAQDADR